ncbi:MAG: hemerythrin domain-containing protein [Limnohabitans sp.]
MQHLSIRTINEEHASLSAVLHSIRMMIQRGPQDDRPRFFEVLTAMLFYIDEVPEKQHHRKESELLFPPLAQRSAQCAAVIAQLDKDHAQGELAVRALQHLLLAWQLLGDTRRAAFEAAAGAYLDFYRRHMHLEETVILPEALKVLTDEDWLCLDAAFASNCDPLSANAPRDPIYERLFTTIATQAPAPIGLGQR